MQLSDKPNHIQFFFKCLFKSIRIWLKNGDQGRGFFESIHDIDGRVKIKYFIQKGNPNMILEKVFYPHEILKIVIMNPRHLSKIPSDSHQNEEFETNVQDKFLLNKKSQKSIDLSKHPDEQIKFGSFSDTHTKKSQENELDTKLSPNKLIPPSICIIIETSINPQLKKLMITRVYPDSKSRQTYHRQKD